MASIRDVAVKAGVSTATVSRTFASPDLIKAQTQERVLAAARSLNYWPPRLRESRTLPARSRAPLSSPSIDAIGFQFFTATALPSDTLAGNGFYMSVLLGAQAEAYSLGLHLLIHTSERHAFPIEIPRMIQEKTVGGLLLVGAVDSLILNSLAEHVPNIVLVDNHDETKTYESIVSDGFTGAFTLTRYLQELGHKRIGFFLSEPGVMTFRDRLHGYRCAMLDAGTIPTADLVFGVGATLGEIERTELVAYMRSPDRPTAIVCANDDAAVYLLRICRELEIKVPHDLSVAGFDDMPFASTAEPPLTTVRVEKELLGRIAVRRLYDRFKNASGTLMNQWPIRHTVPVSLVVRNSCCPLL